MTKTKFEAMDILNKYDIPCGPILSMKEIAEEPSLRATGTVVEVDHPKRGKYLTRRQPDQAVGQPDRGEALAAARRAHRRSAARELGYSERPDRRSCARRKVHLKAADRQSGAPDRATSSPISIRRHDMSDNDKREGPRRSSTRSRRRGATR